MTDNCTKAWLIVLIAIAAAIIGIIAYLNCVKNKMSRVSEMIDIDIVQPKSTPAAAPEQPPAKEGFISSGVDGAFYNARTNSIQGNSLYSNQMIQNNQNWKNVVDTAKTKDIASDGIGSLGAGKGNGFDDAYVSQKKLSEAWDSVRNGYMSNEEYNKLSQEINVTTAPQSDTSMLNRGNQNCGKMSILPNKLVCVVDEKYMDERSKNYDIFKTNTIVHCQGYDIDTNNVGRALSDTHFPKYIANSPGHRKITSAGASANGLKVIENTDDPVKSEKENFRSKLNREGFQHASTKGYKTLKNSEGGVWCARK